MRFFVAMLLMLAMGAMAAPQPATDTPNNDTQQSDEVPQQSDVTPFASAQNKQIFIPSASGPVTINARLDEPQWQQANTFTLDFVTQPFNNTAAPVTTEVAVFEDGETLYVAFIASDPNPGAISAFFRDRDQIWSNDLVGIKLDTFNNERLAYQFFVNPFGVQADAIENEMTGEETDSWNAIWDSAGQITETGYVVEIAIPLRAMNFDESSKKKVWGAEFVRFYPREDRLRLSNLPYDRDNACVLCQMGEVAGFDDATQGNNLALVPTLVLGRSEQRAPVPGANWQHDTTAEAGVDVTWGITPQVSLQATLNPDFSQVEADVAQVSINNTFSLYFDERRPFFVENAGYFSTNQNLVYTRNINAPDVGAKLTGQVGQHTFGVFAADDNLARFIVPGNLGSSVATLATDSNNAALRYRYDYNQDFSIGWVSTLRQADNYHNYVSGFDMKYRLTGQDTLRAQWVYSDTEYPTELFEDFCRDSCQASEDFSETALRTNQDENFGGSAWRVNYLHEQEDWFVRADHFANDADFRADLGFETKVDFHKSIVGGGYMWWNDNSWWNRIRVNGDWDITHNDAGELIEREVEMFASIRGTYQSFFEIGRTQRERVGLRFDPSVLTIAGNTDRFDEVTHRLYMEARPNPYVYVSQFLEVGDQIDFANNRLGEQLYSETELDMNLGRHAQIRLTHTFSDLDVADQPLFTARLTDVRMTYQFDARQFVRLIVAYSNVTRNPANYSFAVEAQNRSVSGQLLYSYKLNPLTKFFVGVASGAVEQGQLTDLTETNKSVFMKFSYAWLR